MSEETAIKNGSGKWGSPLLPKFGWEYCAERPITDEETPVAVCEMCERTQIRYVHHLRHPVSGDRLDVGCICAGHLIRHMGYAKKMEAAIKTRAKFPERKGWKRSRKGNWFIKVDGWVMTVHNAGRAWRVHLSGRGHEVKGARVYRSEHDARLAAWDAWQYALRKWGKRRLTDFEPQDWRHACV